MKFTLLAAMAFSAAAFAASADPMELSDAQMDQVSAGLLDNNLLSLTIPIAVQTSVPVSVNAATAIAVLAENIAAVAQQDVDSSNLADVTNALMN